MCGSCAAGGRRGVAVARIMGERPLGRGPRGGRGACVLGRLWVCGVGVVAPARKCLTLVGAGRCAGRGGMTLHEYGLEVM